MARSKGGGKSTVRTKGRGREKRNAGKKGAAGSVEEKRAGVIRAIRSLPPGTVSSYGAVARAAGWTGAARQVVRILQQVQGLPWQRVVGSGGAIKLPGEFGADQRLRLRMEGVTFRGARVNMRLHEFRFPASRVSRSESFKVSKAGRTKTRKR